MSATTSPYGSSSGRASVPGPGSRSASGRPTGRAGQPDAYRDRPAGREDRPPRAAGPGGPGGPPPRGPGRSGGPNQPYRGKRKPRWGRIALLGGIVVVVLGVVAAISAYGYADHL